jgi:2-polyprenyl-3-methyl-5-hydroxy-6-metoxy-1,4-benzoquinol methylase
MSSSAANVLCVLSLRRRARRRLPKDTVPRTILTRNLSKNLDMGITHKPNVFPICGFKKFFEQIDTLSPQKGKLLDIGCAFGYFLMQAREKGWDIHGLERSSYAVDYAKKSFGLDIQLGTLEKNSYPDNFFQAVTLFDVIEHVSSPTEALRQIHRILAPGGLLVMTTPNESGLLRKLMGKHWFHFKPLEHNYFFSSNSMTQFLKKSGF